MMSEITDKCVLTLNKYRNEEAGSQNTESATNDTVAITEIRTSICPNVQKYVLESFTSFLKDCKTSDNR